MSGAAILGCGMCTASGLTAPAAAAAFRARIENFQETRFISQDGAWVIGAEVPLETPWRGLARHVHMLTGPIEECFAAVPKAVPEQTALLLCVAEEDRAGRLSGLDNELPQRAMSIMAKRFGPGSNMIKQGPAGGAVALKMAADLIAAGTAAHVIVAGVDSFLLSPTIRAMDADDRLLTEANSNGFVAGEAGGAIILGRAQPGALRLLGTGFAMEQATLASGQPFRAEGMTQAYKAALGEAGLTMGRIDYRIADMTGERYYFKEAALALTRVMRERKEFMDFWTPTDTFGHTGAASVPLLLSVAYIAARKRYAPGPVVLAQASDDDGRRAAMVLGWEG